MGFFDDFIAPLAREAKVISSEFESLKGDVVDAVTSTSQVAQEIKQNITEITTSVKTEASQTVSSVKEAILPSNNSSSDK